MDHELRMELSDDLRCLFSAPVEARDGSYVIEVPAQEVDLGDVAEHVVYRVALFGTDSPGEIPDSYEQDRSEPGPPVADGDERTVDIETLGDQGDGIARVERGYVLIVPETEKGERVTVKVTDTRENMAFAEVIEREDYYE